VLEERRSYLWDHRDHVLSRRELSRGDQQHATSWHYQ
jgi:hypothetical protein